MKNEEQETQFMGHVRSGLDREAENLDIETATRLKRIRYSAIEQIDSSRFKLWRLLRLPALAVVTGVIIATVVITDYRSPTIIQNQHALADLEILASDEQLNLFDDLEFYSWLAETEDHAS